MSNLSTRRIVSIVKQAPKSLNLSYSELENKCIKVMEGKGHIGANEDYWDFLEKNKWGLSTVLSDKTKVLPGSFDGAHGLICYGYLCKSCEGIFRVPFETKECMFCGNADMEREKMKVRVGQTHGRAGVQDGVNPELYAMAVKDIQENGSAPSGPDYEPDWKYLEENI